MAGHGIRLRQALDARGIGKLYALAVEIGVDQSALSRWKDGGTISTGNAIRLCQALDISLDWFLIGRGDMNYHIGQTIASQDRKFLLRLRSLTPEAQTHLANFLDCINSDAQY